MFLLCVNRLYNSNKMMIMIQLLSLLLLFMIQQQDVKASSSSSTLSSSSSSLIHLVDGSKSHSSILVQSIPSSLTFQDKGIVTIMKSPNTPLSKSLLILNNNKNKDEIVDNDNDDNVVLSMLNDNTNNMIRFICRGAIVKGTTNIERSSMYFCSLLSNSIILTGIHQNDYYNHHNINTFHNSRHSRTLTAIFRSKLLFSNDLNYNNNIIDNNNNNNINNDINTDNNEYKIQQSKKQSIILLVDDINDINDNIDHTNSNTSTDTIQLFDLLKKEVYIIYQAVAVEKSNLPTFDQLYNLYITSDPKEALSIANENAMQAKQSLNDNNVDNTSLLMASKVFTSTWSIVHDYDVSGLKSSLMNGLDSSLSASIFVIVMDSYSKYSQLIQNKLLIWKKRISRGLYIEQYNIETNLLIQKCLYNGYDIDTLDATGLPQIAKYRLELRNQLLNLLETNINDLYQKQLINIQSIYTKRLQNDLLKNMIKNYKNNNGDSTNTYESNESYINTNAALLRQQSFAVESILDNIQVPLLGLTKDKSIRIITSALNDILINFDDSNIAKLQRTKLMNKNVNSDKKMKNKKKNKKSKQPSLGFGIDIVAMIRPDGFGTFQGFAGYSLPGGNSITVGLHNDADDPQVIAQFGGIRPPLLRIQPKLRVDVEL